MSTITPQESITPQEILERAVSPGGALEHVRQEIEAEIQAEEEAKEKARAKWAKESEKALREREAEYRDVRERRWECLLQLAALTHEYEETYQRYQAAKRVARSAGIQFESIFPYAQEATRPSNYELRKQVQDIQWALARGVT